MSEFKRNIMILFFLSISGWLRAQDEFMIYDSVPDFMKVYLDCSDCYNLYLKEKIDYVQFVNDQNDADIYLMGFTQTTGSGGNEFKYLLIGQGPFAGLNDTLVYASLPTNTDAEKRQMIYKLISSGMMQYIAKTDFYQHIDIVSTKKTGNYLIQDTKDKWHKWVFDTELQGNSSGRNNANQSRIKPRILVSKVTPDWKTEMKGTVNYNWNYFELEDKIINSKSNEKIVSGYYAKNINSHWALGAKYYFYSGTTINIKGAHHFSPVIEYNLFDYAEASQRQLRFMNKIEVKRMYYYDTTVYNVMQEYRMDNILSIGYEVRQKFGDILIAVQAFNYLEDIKLYKYSFDSRLNIRVVKGLFFQMNGNISYTQDQFYLPKKSASNEDVLLGNIAVASSYNYGLTLGITYRFGSIYNSVVNPIFRDI